LIYSLLNLVLLVSLMLPILCIAIMFLWNKPWTVLLWCVGIDSYYVSCAVKDWYSTWDKLPYKTHLAHIFP